MGRSRLLKTFAESAQSLPCLLMSFFIMLMAPPWMMLGSDTLVQVMGWTYSCSPRRIGRGGSDDGICILISKASRAIPRRNHNTYSSYNEILSSYSSTGSVLGHNL